MYNVLFCQTLKWRFFNAHLQWVSKYCKKPNENPSIMKILNVAEKNDAAKHIAGYLSGGNSQRREGLSQYNKIYEFNYNFRGRNAKMTMTSVSGHLLNHEFVGNYRRWNGCSPDSLFDAPVVKECSEDFVKIKNTIEREVRTSDVLIIWTDCDREGENIGFEIITVCRRIKPNIEVLRAKFSEITSQSVRAAMANLGPPNKRISDAVDVRSELDLRIGAAFTRFQTLRLKRVFPEVLANHLISYGSCQFPTLGFVVERYKAIQDFIPEQFWKIKVVHKIKDVSVEFMWKRVRLFDQPFCEVLYKKCMEKPKAVVENVTTKPKSKWRPLPLDTVELEKVGSRKLKINAKETMRIAERLYTQGLISYPRTETNIFPAGMGLPQLVEEQTGDNRWGQFATKVLENGVNPRQGKKSDQAHPPIHPTKYTDGLNGNERKVYEYVVRHFLACVSKDAEGLETTVEIDINNEKFLAHGLQILALNYLEVYPYEKWNAKEIHEYQRGQSFDPTSIDLVDGETNAPRLLTEADLISLMEKHGIGTDATHAEHIDKIKTREYVGLLENMYFVPGELGIGLVEGYDSMGFEMSKPRLRAELEKDLQGICDGTKDPKVVLQNQIQKYREVFRKAVEQANKLDEMLAKYFNTQPAFVENNANVALDALPEYALKCSSCGSGMVLKARPNNTSFISCLGYPPCRQSIWFPEKVLEVTLAPDTCVECGNDVRLLKFKFRSGSMAPYYSDVYTGCIGGCDPQLIAMLEIRQNARAAPTTATAPAVNYNANNNANTRNVGQNRNNEFRNPPRTQTTVPRPTGFNSNLPNDDGADVQCNCGQDAKRFTVQKDTPNKGRQFFSCAKLQSDATRCSFFLWADFTDNNATANRNEPRNPRPGFTNFNNRAGPSFKARKRGNSTRTSAGTRKCGNCRQEGHNRNNCPNL